MESLLGLEVTLRDGKLHLPPNQGTPAGASGGEKGFDVSVIQRLLDQFGDEITAVRLGRPTLDDVFLARTGRTITGSGDGDGDGDGDEIREAGENVSPGEGP